MAERLFFAIGGGEIRAKSTLSIDKHIAALAKERVGTERRPYALFFPTASHDSKPYFNSFRKTYTSECDVKCDVAILTKGEMTVSHILEKIDKSDIIYVGGGDTLYLIDVWRETGIDKAIWQAYQRGAILAGLSAGAICWFDKIYTDSAAADISADGSEPYAMADGLGYIGGTITPHYNMRTEFDGLMLRNAVAEAYAVEDNCAIVFKNEQLAYSLTSGSSSAYILQCAGKEIIKSKI